MGEYYNGIMNNCLHTSEPNQGLDAGRQQRHVRNLGHNLRPRRLGSKGLGHHLRPPRGVVGQRQALPLSRVSPDGRFGE